MSGCYAISERKTVEVNQNSDFCYFIVDLKNNCIVDKNLQKLKRQEDFIRNISFLSEALGKKVYGVSTAKLDKVISSFNHLSDEVEAKINETLKIMNLSSVDEYNTYYNVYNNLSKYDFEKFLVRSKNPKFTSYVDKINNIKNIMSLIKDHKAFNSLILHSKEYNITYTNNSDSLIQELESIKNEFVNYYPLLKRFDFTEDKVYNYSTCSYNYFDIQNIFDYIEMVDKGRGLL